MRRQDLEHIIRAAGGIIQADELVIIGSQAILGSYPHAPPELLTSMEADVYPLTQPGKADLIDGSIGEGSLFHMEFGYYAHGIGPETAFLPARWRERLVPICNENTRRVTGLCLHPCDLAVSKLLAGRDQDFRFVQALLRHRLVSEDAIREVARELGEEHERLVNRRLLERVGTPNR
ncbi:MAG: hypothetical protein FJ278_01430 [Planctomycetes bacterium]|nr:hypothetical protein [Planctomycetota bacterium]